MLKKHVILPFFIMGLISLAGCPGPLIVGGAAIGAASGTYFYINGELKTDYYTSFDKVWNAVEKTIADMRGINVEPAREIGAGVIKATINEESVRFDIRYKAKNVTTVAIRIGTIGNKLSSQLIHDKIADNIK
ncbi:MAG: DUF3568 family protein [Deltaproteobacteria bacterium]|nr:DUF3568 family protein [Deltaproteobacteria bacterium]